MPTQKEIEELEALTKIIDIEEFSTIVKEYITIDDTIKKAQNDMKLLRKKKVDLNQGIMVFMEENNVQQCNIPSGGAIKRAVTKTKSSAYKKETLETKITNFFRENPNLEGTPEEKAKKLLKFIEESREIIEKICLRRTKT